MFRPWCYDVSRCINYTVTTQAGDPVVAPPLLRYEVTNVVRQQMRRQGLSLLGAQLALARFRRYPVQIVAHEAIHDDALVFADRFGLPATYDARCLALASRLGCPLWTDDRRLVNLLGGALPFVMSIDQFQTTSVAVVDGKPNSRLERRRHTLFRALRLWHACQTAFPSRVPFTSLVLSGA